MAFPIPGRSSAAQSPTTRIEGGASPERGSQKKNQAPDELTKADQVYPQISYLYEERNPILARAERRKKRRKEY